MLYYTGNTEVIVLKTDMDWTGATVKSVEVRQPDGTHLHFVGDAVTVIDAPLGVVSIEFTMTMPGEHFVQAFRALSSVDKRHSEWQDFYVSDPIA